MGSQKIVCHRCKLDLSKLKKEHLLSFNNEYYCLECYDSIMEEYIKHINELELESKKPKEIPKESKGNPTENKEEKGDTTMSEVKTTAPEKKKPYIHYYLDDSKKTVYAHIKKANNKEMKIIQRYVSMGYKLVDTVVQVTEDDSKKVKYPESIIKEFCDTLKNEIPVMINNKEEKKPEGQVLFENYNKVKEADSTNKLGIKNKKGTIGANRWFRKDSGYNNQYIAWYTEKYIKKEIK